jgi:hypothetical protein
MKSVCATFLSLLFLLAQLCVVPSVGSAGPTACGTDPADDSPCCRAKRHHCQCCIEQAPAVTPPAAVPAPVNAGHEFSLQPGALLLALWTLPSPPELPAKSRTVSAVVRAQPVPLFLRQGTLLI